MNIFGFIVLIISLCFSMPGWSFVHEKLVGCTEDGSFCCNNSLRFRNKHIVLERKRASFADGSLASKAIKKAADRWND